MTLEQRERRDVDAAADPTVDETLVRVALQVSRAQLLLTGTLDHLPGAMRELAEDSLDELTDAVQQLRRVVVAGRVPSPRAPRGR